jgi:hypothetical protein
MTKEFIVYRDTLIEALNHLEDFSEKMDSFVEKRPEYSYDSTIEEKGTSWEIIVKVNKDEQTNITTT